MNAFTGTALYVTLWWTLLFAVLPFGVRPVPEADETTGWRGAPAGPRIGRVVLINTLLTTLVWVICYVVITGPWLSFRSGWLAMQ